MSSVMTPRTIFGMTLYNNARHLREATDSILRQTHRDFLLLMLDDGSTSDVQSIAREYEQRDDRARYFRHPQRRGMVATWEDGAENAPPASPQAEFFAWVSDHDRWESEWLARMIAVLEADRGAVLAYPRTLRIDEGGA